MKERNSPRNSRALAAWCAIALAACFPARSAEPTLLYDIRVKLPLDREMNQICEQNCNDTLHEGTKGYVECVAKCEGAEIADRVPCDPRDHRPAAICYEVRARVEGADTGELASIIVDSIVATTAVVADAVANPRSKKK